MGLVKIIANVAGILGIAICGFAVLLRVAGNYYLAGMEMMTLFSVGIAVMVFSCLLKLECLQREIKEKKP